MKNKENELRTWGGKVVMALVLVMTLVGGLSAQEIDLLVKDTTSISANSLAGQQADAFSFRAGVTTMVDAGSAGWHNFPLYMGTEKLEAELTFRAGRVVWYLNGMNATDWVMPATTN